MAFQFLHLRRDTGVQSTHTTPTLAIVLVILLVFAVVLAGSLLLLRQRRRARAAAALPVYNDKRVSTSSTQCNHRRVRARPSQSIHIYHDKEIRVEQDSACSSPTNSLPEIRITFPEEVDATGKRQSGRVVVVHVGDTSVGLGPVQDGLPAYEQHGGSFQAVDLEKVGGLEEKESRPPLGWT